MVFLQINPIDIIMKSSSHILFLILLFSLLALFFYLSFRIKYAPIFPLILSIYLLIVLEYNSWSIIMQWWGCDFMEGKVICGFPSHTVYLDTWQRSYLLVFNIAIILSSFLFLLINYMYRLKEE
jgi:hypothetical protein